MPICDHLARRRLGPEVDPVIAYLSFLKKLDIPIVLDIWRQADVALRQAQEIEIRGYSLSKRRSGESTTQPAPRASLKELTLNERVPASTYCLHHSHCRLHIRQKVLGFIGATRRIRTDDLLITNCVGECPPVFAR
jgi:hypothetical protein